MTKNYIFLENSRSFREVCHEIMYSLSLKDI